MITYSDPCTPFMATGSKKCCITTSLKKMFVNHMLSILAYVWQLKSWNHNCNIGYSSTDIKWHSKSIQLCDHGQIWCVKRWYYISEHRLDRSSKSGVYHKYPGRQLMHPVTTGEYKQQTCEVVRLCSSGCYWEKKPIKIETKWWLHCRWHFQMYL